VGTNVKVVQADATNLPFSSARFSAATCFTMLHHVRTPVLQDRLMVELRRLIRPGGIVLGTDSVETPARRELHLGDVYVPIDPAGWQERIETAGFVAAEVEQREDRFRFVAQVPL
jgi:ubiquinone/menaquinone biosynthesis C-methylase UbiE